MDNGRACEVISMFEIRIRGHLDDRRARSFADLVVTPEPDGTTTLVGPFADQAALHGVLGRIRDLGLYLLSVRQVRPD